MGAIDDRLVDDDDDGSQPILLIRKAMYSESKMQPADVSYVHCLEGM